MAAHDALEFALVFLLATVVVVPLFNRLKLGAVLAYLLAGALLGPHALGAMNGQHGEFEAAELGVVLLLFLIGIELSPARLWLMRRALLTVGSLQVAGSALILGIAVFALGQTWRTALVAGFALALSSTAIGVQTMAERKALGAPHGRNALAVLLFQDLVAIPAIALIPLLGAAAVAATPAPGETTRAILKVLGAIGLVVLAGHYLTRPLLRYVAATKSVEAFTAAILLIVLSTAWITSQVGMSMALGAFLAGVLLADSEYRHEAEAAIEPFKGLLLGLFFMGVGLSVDWAYVARHGLDVLIGVAGLLGAKFLWLYLIARRHARLELAEALRFAVLLACGGEFAFVLFSLAASSGLMEPALKDLFTVIVVLSMAATPLGALGVEAFLARMPGAEPRPFDTIDESGHSPPRVIIAGFGRVGQIVARVLRAQKVPFVALDQSIEQVDLSRRFGSVIYYGDPARPEVLRAAGAASAEIYVVTTDDPEANVRSARLVKRLYPHLRVYARARNRQHAYKLMDLGLEEVVRETFHSSLYLSRRVLEGLGVSSEQAQQRIERFRRHDEKLLLEQHLVQDDEAKLVQSNREALVELTQIFEADEVT
jgi:glutathione-regulated potassium-efflux system protein KefB